MLYPRKEVKLPSKRKQLGVALIEYSLIAALISVAAITALGTVGTKIVNVLTQIAAALP